MAIVYTLNRNMSRDFLPLIVIFFLLFFDSCGILLTIGGEIINFLEKLDLMMERYSLNKNTLSQKSGIPYTTIDGWYKKGYEGMKLSTLRILSNYFNTVVDYWVSDDVTDPNAWKANGFVVDTKEMGHIQKYRLLDPEWKEAVDNVLNIGYRQHKEKEARDTIREQQEEMEAAEEIGPEIYFITPCFLSPMSAGTGQIAGDEYPENYKLIKEPPRGTSYIASVSGDSMEPNYHDGDKLFIHACTEIKVGQIGVFYMDGQQWIKELGNGVLISHNSKYTPRQFTDDIQCQGLVLGVCDESYFE